MTDLDAIAELSIRLALQELNAAFCYRLDHHQVDALADLFPADAVYTHGERRSEGRVAIRALFAARAAGGERTTRHLNTGLLLQIDSDSAARGDSVCLTFAYDGRPPVTPAIPYLVADFKDLYQRCADGRWRIAVRDIRRIFAAESNPGPVGGIR